MIYPIYKIDVLPNTRGVVFYKGKIKKVLNPGVYKYYFVDSSVYRFAILNSETRSVSIFNQEILSKDQVAFRISFIAEYIIKDFEKVSKLLDFSNNQSNFPTYWMNYLDNLIFQEVQIEMNIKLSQIGSEEIFDDYKKLNVNEDELDNINSNLNGIEVKKIRIKELSFPKMIQELFSKRLEAKIKSKTDLENARTTVATTRALSNAGATIKENEGIKYIMYLDTLKEISAKGKNTFVIGKEGIN